MPSGKTFKKNSNTNKSRKNFSNAYSFQRNITVKFLEMLIMIKLYHWKTHSYATHKATDELYTSLNANMDKFVEVLLGKTHSRIQMNSKSIPLIDLNSQDALIKKIQYFKGYLTDLNNESFMRSMSNTDLFNIRDEILGNLNQFLYLLSFK